MSVDASPHDSISDVAANLIGKVAVDSRLPASVRVAAARLRADALKDPEAALDRLESLWADAVPHLTLESPKSDLARCVGVSVFWQYHLKRDVRAVNPTAEAYRRLVESSPSPDARLLEDLADDRVLFPAQHSWLTRYESLGQMTGAEIRVALQINPAPPIVVFVLARDRLVSTGVRVRQPTALDAVPDRLVRYQVRGLPSGLPEFLDQDLPRETVVRVEWRE
jgi:hypothetical protein